MIYFLTTLSLASLAAVLSLGSIFAILAKLLTPYVMRAQQDENAVSVEEASKVLEKKKRIAQIIMVVLFIVAIPIVVTMWTIPPTGYYSNLFGVDLGVLFLILGEEFSLYHYVVYKKPVEKEE
jgi:predicted nucleic acid-binding Zn ribbon protein